MSESEIRRRTQPPSFVGGLVRYWPVALGIFAIIVAGAEARIQIARTAQDVAALVAKQEADRANVAQWRSINENRERGIDHAARLEAVEVHISPAAIQRWGWAQGQIETNAQALQRHLSGHPR